ncbi:MAG: hypothetical protein US30_C0006G0010 [Candidatus Moranbacteria bacterium GW2011_GWF2_36_839]|nr:MAG: hypothetical protein US27_C0006G0017 [Candidatus Moranbacteria bacterium GW2011_GWF1_36_78]KKQ17121.1 MAG: hypothetical protein US30_C0006G0010 [Candidatus Moranbacteria bacterium GW2011_GWF2_36_839]HAT74113.1 hypothetical protein [Candidatus Moranbacteria bacterium]
MKANISMLLYNKSKNMYIKRNQEQKEQEEKMITAPEPQKFLPPDDFSELEAPHDMLIEKHSRDVRLHWRAPEFETFERDRKWYFYITAILIAIVAYAIFTNGLVMAITFILIGVVGYIYIEKDPRTLDFMLTRDGVVAGREIYDFDNIRSFWVFYEEDGLRVISLHTESYLAPFIHIPIHDQDPTEIRKILLEYIPEEEHKPGMMDTLDRLLRL